MKLCTRDSCANMQKNVEQIFKNFDFKIFGGFLTFQFGLSYGAM